jgi:hypothetical protein
LAKQLIEILLFAIVVAFIIAVGQTLIAPLFDTTSKAFEAFLGGFVGAFFAFVFVRLGEFLTKLFERARTNTAALMTLQHRLIEAALTISDNVHSLEVWQQLPDRPTPTLWMNRLHSVEFPRDALLALTNIDLLNELMDLHLHLRRLSVDFEGFNRSYQQLADLLLKERDEMNYRAGLASMLPSCGLLERHSRAYEGEITKALATIRTVLHERTFGERCMAFLTRRHFPRGFETRRQTAITTLTAEIAQRTAENRERIAKIEQAGPQEKAGA